MSQREISNEDHRLALERALAESEHGVEEAGDYVALLRALEEITMIFREADADTPSLGERFRDPDFPWLRMADAFADAAALARERARQQGQFPGARLAE